MSQIIVYAEPDGAARIISPGRSLERAMERCVPRGARHVAVIDSADLPQDRTHRDAWVWDGSKVVVDPSRIRRHSIEAPAIGQSAAPAPVDLSSVFAELQRVREEAAATIREIAGQLQSWVIRYSKELPVAMNALKPDEEITTAKLSAVRDEARRLMAKEGAAQNPPVDWETWARQIVDQHNAETRKVLGGGT